LGMSINRLLDSWAACPSCGSGDVYINQDRPLAIICRDCDRVDYRRDRDY
jgi:hypothetical protein